MYLYLSLSLYIYIYMYTHITIFLVVFIHVQVILSYLYITGRLHHADERGGPGWRPAGGGALVSAGGARGGAHREPLVQHHLSNADAGFSSKVATSVEHYGDPEHYKQRIQPMRPY